MAVWTQCAISRWADHTFGTAYDALTIGIRANKEMQELLTALAANRKGGPEILEEIADVVIVLKRW